jgi:hypothetical protein
MTAVELVVTFVRSSEMNKKVKLGALLAVAAVAPAIVAPQLVSNASAQTAVAEYPDVPKGHWAYDALNTLSAAGIIEGRPGGNYYGNQPMTRYEFAVAIARLLKNMGGVAMPGAAYNDTELRNRITNLENKPAPVIPAQIRPDITRAEVNDLIKALRTEFADELANLGVRVGAAEDRITALETRVAKPARLTVTPGILHRSGTASYISNGAGGAPAGGPKGPAGLFGAVNGFGALGAQPQQRSLARNATYVDGKFSYTDFELRLTDRVTDRLSVNAALRSLSGTNEDSWSGDTDGAANLREAFAVANLGDRSFLGLKGLNLILGRQRTRFGQGLLYDNDLAPTDQLHAQFNLGPLQFNAISGTNNNNTGFGGFGADPYSGQGAVAAFGANNTLNFNTGAGSTANGGSFVGFPSAPGVQPGTPGGARARYTDDNETLLRGSFNLFKISGNPVNIGLARQFDGYQDQKADSLDLSVPLFNRTIGVEYVRQRQYADSSDAKNASAYNITVPVLRARVLDLNFAYGKAKDNFEYLVTSAANPYARSYGEALFDRPLALGSPMIANGRDVNGAGAGGQTATFMAAKKVFDFNGTLRILRRLPLDFRYYQADGSNGVDLGKVYTVGSTFNISPGLDLEVKYGQYNPENYEKVRYFRVGANVGF